MLLLPFLLSAQLNRIFNLNYFISFALLGSENNSQQMNQQLVQQSQQQQQQTPEQQQQHNFQQ